jgi:hypothetical protein
MYTVQNKEIADMYYSATDRNFLHPLPRVGIGISEMKDEYKDPKVQIPRTFRSQRNFDRDPEKLAAYTKRWTKGAMGMSQTATMHRDFFRKQK